MWGTLIHCQGLGTDYCSWEGLCYSNGASSDTGREATGRPWSSSARIVNSSLEGACVLSEDDEETWCKAFV